MRPEWRSLAHYESGPMSQSALKKIAALRRCGGLLSRLAYERGRKEGVDVEVLLRQAHLTPRQIKNKDIQLGVQNQIKFVELVANATGDPLLGFHLAYSYDLREIGLLYYVIASAETLLGSLLRVARYSACCQRRRRFGSKQGKSSSCAPALFRCRASQRRTPD